MKYWLISLINPTQLRKKCVYLFNILHPLSHLGVAHLVDLLDELIVFLPESHLGAGLNSTVCKWESFVI